MKPLGPVSCSRALGVLAAGYLGLLAGCPAGAEDVPPPAKPDPTGAERKVDAAPLPPLPANPAVTPEMTQQALGKLPAVYMDFANLQSQAGETLAALVARSKGGLQFQSGRDGVLDNQVVSGILTATLPDNYFYLRLANFTPKTEGKVLDADLREALARKPGGIILDLRSNRAWAATDYDEAGQIGALLSRAPELFSARGFAPSWDTVKSWKNEAGIVPSCPVMVLVDARTSGAAEALAAALQAGGAIVLGQPTAGCSGIFETTWLSDTLALDSLVARVSLPATGGAKELWGHPVVPDVILPFHEKAERVALLLIGHGHVTDVIKESDERHRLSEASLVKGDDPEWDAYLAALERKPDDHYLTLPPSRDPALIAALDSLKAIEVSQRQQASPEEGTATAGTAASRQ